MVNGNAGSILRRPPESVYLVEHATGYGVDGLPLEIVLGRQANAMKLIGYEGPIPFCIEHDP